MHGDERVLRRVGEQRRLAEDRDEDRVRDDAREDRRDERVGLEVVAMEHLDGEERGAERRAEDGGHARRGAGHQQDAALAIGDAQVATDDRADRAADLHRRPFAAAGSADAEREDRGEALEQRNAPADVPRREWNASMIASAPPPRVSGAYRERRPAPSAPRAGMSQTSHGRNGVTATSLVMRSPAARSGTYPHSRSSTTCCTSSTPAKKIDPMSPAATPTSAALSSARPSSCIGIGLRAASTARVSTVRIRVASRPGGWLSLGDVIS